MARDDFSRNDVDILAKRVGVRCSNPSCRKLTTGPRSESNQIVNIGVAAHITAASEGGARYDPNISSEGRRSIKNGIWLCQNCAKLIDNDPNRYKVELLLQWRTEAERAAHAAIEGRGENQVRDGFAELELSWKTRYRSTDRHDYDLFILLRNLGAEALGPYHVDVEFPRSVMHQPHSYPMYVARRSAEDTVFLRTVSERDHPGEKIYPGDDKVVMKLAYFMTDQIYRTRGTLFNQLVRATLFQDGFRPVMVEEIFGDFQEF
ncbi:MAG: hypothetical protein HYY97_16425 [Rhodocyclales bacterium]|nr:hypothetical protein [Rhodocyclales bacterium]